MAIWEYIILFLAVIVGGGLAFFFKDKNKIFLQLTLSFSGAYILGITFLHLVPEVYHHNNTAGYFVLLGFLIQLLLEQLSKGIEHGHIHAAHHPKRSFAISIMIGLCIHAFMEGMPLSAYTALEHVGHSHNHEQNHLLLGIIFHKIPAAFALVLLLLLSKFPTKTILTMLIFFSLMSPLGAFVASNLDKDLLDGNFQSIILSVVIGSFLHISTTILFEMESDHKIPMPKLIAILVGLAFAIGTML